MELILFLFSAVVCQIGATNGQVVCHSGYRRSFDGDVLLDNYMGTVCPSGKVCQATIIQKDLGSVNIDYLELANCVSSSTNISCAQAQAQNTYPMVAYQNCSTTTCNSFLCNAPKLPSGCTNKELPDDVRVLPSCTLRESYINGMSCLNTYFKGFPYSDTTECNATINPALSCLVSLISTCLSGYCPTVLDALAVPLALNYQVVIGNAANIDSIEKLFLIPGLNDTYIQDEILKAVCLQSDSILLRNITGFLETLGAVNLNLTFENPVCDNDMLNDLYKDAMAEMPNMINAKTHSAHCMSLNKIKTMALNAWKTRCNKSAVIEVLRPLLGPLYSPLLPEIEKAMNIVEGFVESPEFLGCTERLTTTTTLVEGDPTTTLPPASSTHGSSDSSTSSTSNTTPPTNTASPASSTKTDSPAETAKPTSTLAPTTTSGAPTTKQQLFHSMLVALTFLTVLAL